MMKHLNPTLKDNRANIRIERATANKTVTTDTDKLQFSLKYSHKGINVYCKDCKYLERTCIYGYTEQNTLVCGSTLVYNNPTREMLLSRSFL